jgi:hypothetical protein
MFNIPGIVEKMDRSHVVESLNRPMLVRQDRYWAAVQLYRLPSDHVLRQRIADGWRGGELERPSAVLGPCYGGKPAAFVAVADVLRWTADLREPQRYQEMVEERKRLADEAERQRQHEQSERGRLERIEKELASLKK